MPRYEANSVCDEFLPIDCIFNIDQCFATALVDSLSTIHLGAVSRRECDGVWQFVDFVTFIHLLWTLRGIIESFQSTGHRAPTIPGSIGSTIRHWHIEKPV